jgi:hypothetical protein
MRWVCLTLALGGMLFQQPLSCNLILAQVTAGLSTSITNQLIRNVVNDTLGLPRTGTGLLGN